MGWKKCAVCDEWRKNSCKTVTPLNLPTIAAVLRAEGIDLELSCDVTPRQVVCGDCYTDEMVSRHAALAEASKHVGNILRRLDDGCTETQRGEVTALARKPTNRVCALFEVTWESGSVETMTAEQLAVPEAWGRAVEELMHASASAAARRTASRINKAAKRLEQKIADDPPMEEGAPDDDEVFGYDPMRGENVDIDELNTWQRQTLRRALSRRNIFDREWWEGQVTRTGKPRYERLHKFLFGFENQRDLRGFYELEMVAYHGPRSSRNSLGPFEYYCLAILKMRTGLSTDFLGGLMGTDQSHLGRRVAEWIIRLGEYAKAALIVLPPADCLEALMPQSFKDCGMGDTGLVGDGCVFLTEAVRVAWLQSVGNCMYDSKTDHPGAMGMMFCSPNGGACVASPLFLGRCSEHNAVKYLRDQLDDLPSHMAVCYDKGICGLQMILPNYNHVYMPHFLAPSEGKTKFTLEEAVYNKAVATNRYVVEIAFQRVKASGSYSLVRLDVSTFISWTPHGFGHLASQICI